MKNKLKIYPFGGVGEIGSNMTVFETKNHLVIIDYGILFPYDDFFDINYLIADSSQLPEGKEKTLFITHGHEDHIGAISHFVQDHPEVKILAPKFPSVLIKDKLDRRKINREIQIYEESSIFTFDEFELHPIHVTHSIPETFGLVFYNKAFSTLFISDFKFDLNPLFEKPFNYQKIQDLFNKSDKTLAMLDSTNILSPGKTLSESDLTHDLTTILSQNKRTFLTMFASNLYRIQNILEIAKKLNKKVTTIGRSLSRYIDSAEASDLFQREDYPIIDFDSIKNYSDPNIIYIVTGSQGEFLGATKRIINGDQKNIGLTPDDQFVFSSKPIPGNEKQIYRLYNKLADYGVDIITFRTHQIHASGHPCQEDLKELIKLIKPKVYIPIHGETYFLKAHKEFIEENFPDIQPITLANFEGIEIEGNQISKLNFNEIEPHIIHGNDVIIEKEKISERRKLACNGLVTISINHKSKNIQISTKGLPNIVDNELLKLKDVVDYSAFVEFKNRDHDYTTEQIRIKTRNFYNHLIGYKPITIVHMV